MGTAISLQKPPFVHKANTNRARQDDNQRNQNIDRKSTDKKPANRTQKHAPFIPGVERDDFLSDAEFEFILQSTAVDSVGNQTMVRSIRKGNSVKPSAPALSDLDELNEEWTCKICMETAIQTVILPCRHAVSCLQCSNTLKNCPICRGDLGEVITIFFG